MLEGARQRLTELLARLARRAGNPLIEMLLHSPAHRLLSGSVLLIIVRGLRTGRHYTTPVQYVRRGADVYLVTRRGRTWWRNIRWGAPVGLQLRGRHVPAFAEPLEALSEAELRTIFAGSSLLRAARRPDAVIVRARLHEERSAPGARAEGQRREQQGGGGQPEHE